MKKYFIILLYCCSFLIMFGQNDTKILIPKFDYMQMTAGIDIPYVPENETPFFYDTREIMTLVREAADMVRVKGESAFNEFRLPSTPWRQGETYIFVLDRTGKMVVHPDKAMEGKNQINLKDVNGKPIIRGLIDAATAIAGKTDGWYHYEWAVPGGLLPRWKSSYVISVQAPSGKSYIVGCGVYNDRMEKEFVVDIVNTAAGQIEKNKEKAFTLFHDPSGPFIAKDAYIFVVDMNGVELVNPAFPNLEGSKVLDLKDTEGKYLVRDMFKVVETKGEGWVNYMWPKPGESVSTQKSTYVRKAMMGDEWVLVACGVYLADAPKKTIAADKIKAPELMSLVREAAVIFAQKGEDAYPEFRKPNTKWFHDDTYFFVWSMEGYRILNAGNPAMEGRNVTDLKDVLGRPMGKMFFDAARSATGEGWIHYMWPEPGDIFPTWKSSFVKHVTFPSGKEYLVGCGIYSMQMDKAFIEEVVNKAATLIQQQGKKAFPLLRDKKGPFVFMDVYVFVEDTKGKELVNPAHPGLEGKILINEKDVNGKYLVQDYINAALKRGSTWVDYYWYKPGEVNPKHKYSFVRKVNYKRQTFIIGAGFYTDDAVGDKNVVIH